MAKLISCTYCGKQFSSKETHCCHCGLHRYGYRCLVCLHDIPSSHVPMNICLLPKGAHVIRTVSIGRKEWAYHAACLHQIRHLPYVCPGCKTRLSHLDMGILTEQLREHVSTRSDTGHCDPQPPPREQCANCGQPIPLALCMFCQEAVIGDGISGITYERFFRTAFDRVQQTHLQEYASALPGLDTVFAPLSGTYAMMASSMHKICVDHHIHEEQRQRNNYETRSAVKNRLAVPLSIGLALVLVFLIIYAFLFDVVSTLVITSMSLGIGLFMKCICFSVLSRGRFMEWLYALIHIPAFGMFYALCWLDWGPGGDEGWILLPYAVVLQWVLMGVGVALWWSIKG